MAYKAYKTKLLNQAHNIYRTIQNDNLKARENLSELERFEKSIVDLDIWIHKSCKSTCWTLRLNETYTMGVGGWWPPYWYKDGKRTSFQEVFDNVSTELQAKLLYHLDLLKDTNLEQSFG